MIKPNNKLPRNVPPRRATRGKGLKSNQLYDWDRLFDSRSFRMMRGVDYDCSQATIVQSIRNAASKRGLRVSVADFDFGVHVVITHRPAVPWRAGKPGRPRKQPTDLFA